MRILVTGSNGVLGQEVIKAAAQVGECRACTIRDIDISQHHQIADALYRFKPHILINCAGLVKYRPIPDSQYVRVNSLAPHIIAEKCDWYNVKLVHVSTDCVFSGLDGGYPYNERSQPSPCDIYSRSKLAGEVTKTPHLTVRSSFIGYGERGLLGWLLKQKGEIVGYDEAYWSGLTAPVLARALLKLAVNDTTGLVHVYGEAVSKYELLVKLVELFKLDIKVNKGPTPQEHRVNRTLTTLTNWTPEFLSIPTLDTMLKELYEGRNEVGSSSSNRSEQNTP